MMSGTELRKTNENFIFLELGRKTIKDLIFQSFSVYFYQLFGAWGIEVYIDTDR